MGKRIAASVAVLFIGGILYVKIRFNLWIPLKLIFIAALVTPQIVAIVAIFYGIIRRLLKR